MRMEELSESRYEKGTDSVEKYLLGIVQSYFKNQNISSSQSPEAIIKKAVARMKEEVDFESIGVLSLTLPDGQKRIGAVQISLEDLGGEPIITDKKTAFNVNFGHDAGTACEGNDPRLSDSRTPLAHSHGISDILNLEAELLALRGKIDRLIVHDHDNMDTLSRIKYTGSKAAIDLADIEALQSGIGSLLSDMQTAADEYRRDTRDAVADANNAILQAQLNFNTIRDSMDTQSEQYRVELEEEINTQLTNIYSQLDAKFSDYAVGTTLTDLQNAIKHMVTQYGTTTVYMADVIAAGDRYKVADGIPVEIQSIGPGVEPIIDAHIVVDGFKTKMPYFVFNDTLNSLDGAVSVVYDGQDAYVVYNHKNTPPETLRNASIQITYSVKGV